MLCLYYIGRWMMEKKALEHSKATVVAIIAHKIVLLLTSALELHISHMEIAFGYCKLLPVIGKK